ISTGIAENVINIELALQHMKNQPLTITLMTRAFSPMENLPGGWNEPNSCHTFQELWDR
ncbi:hypothetical protein PISMIDRAFT_110599, partial [Pisolithus microcarpus 441]